MDKSAKKLAEMASQNGIAYKPTGGVHYGPTYRKAKGRKWHEMMATMPDGSEHRYFLSHDFGSWRGSWPDEIGA